VAFLIILLAGGARYVAGGGSALALAALGPGALVLDGRDHEVSTGRSRSDRRRRGRWVPPRLVAARAPDRVDQGSLVAPLKERRCRRSRAARSGRPDAAAAGASSSGGARSRLEGGRRCGWRRRSEDRSIMSVAGPGGAVDPACDYGQRCRPAAARSGRPGAAAGLERRLESTRDRWSRR
jgi:hypothetical protein